LFGAAAAVTGGAVVVGPGSTQPASAAVARRAARAAATSRLPFTPIAPVARTVDDVTVPAGYGWDPIIRWGDPIFTDAPLFDAGNQSAAAQAKQFGYNCDYLDIIVTDRYHRKALLVANHEYTNESIMFPPGMDPAELIRTVWAAHGLSVVELRRQEAGGTWR
jgi:secreted PhoX family phosphatase